MEHDPEKTMRRLLSTIFCIGIAYTVSAQSLEVATIKLTDPAFPGILVQFPGGTLSLRGFTVKDIISYAYNLDNRQVIGVPKPLESERYDVVGKAEKRLTPADQDEARRMLQALLSDRFQLQFHRETREMPVYVLTVAKGGPRMKPRTEGDGGAAPSMLFRGANVPGRNVPVSSLAEGLQKLVLDRPIIDKTGLTGNFDFDLSWQPDDAQFGGRGGLLPKDPDKPDIFTAMQEQLGLKLNAQNGEASVVVVDKVEKPSEN